MKEVFFSVPSRPFGPITAPSRLGGRQTCALVDLLTCWLVDYLYNVRLLAFFVNFAIRIIFSENDKENNIIFKTIILKSYGYRL